MPDPTVSRSKTKGKVVLVPFPFDDLSTTKVRPAVCLTEPAGPNRHIVLAFITSAIPNDLLESDLVFDPSNAHFSETGLRQRSALRLHRMMTVSTTIVLRELGVLAPAIEEIVAAKLRILFELD